MDDTIQVHLKVPRELWMELRKDAMTRHRSAQEHVLEMFKVAYGVGAGVASVERKQGSVASKPVSRVEVAPVEEKISGGQIGVPVDPSEMKKCHRCSQPFALDKLTNLPISGGRMKPFCEGCIEDIKNGQA